jgi:hypothetical protein
MQAPPALQDTASKLLYCAEATFSVGWIVQRCPRQTSASE